MNVSNEEGIRLLNKNDFIEMSKTLVVDGISIFTFNIRWRRALQKCVSYKCKICHTLFIYYKFIYST